MWHIDQKVVCVDAHPVTTVSSTYLEVGKTYIISGIRKGCCEVELDVGIVNHNNEQTCSSCGKKGFDSIGWKRASRFRPLDPLEDQMERLEKEGEPIEEHQPEIA